VAKGVADDILRFLALKKNPHKGDCRCLNCRWLTLATALDLRLRFQVEKSLLDRVIGLPAQTLETKHSGKVTLEQLICGGEEDQ
jgi:hypothetical protein